MAQGLIGSEILKIAADIRALAASGRDVCNLTVGDFSPAQFPIPALLESETVASLLAHETNYPPSDGILDLRHAVQSYYARHLGLEYPVESILITSGSRPGIYSTYMAVVDPGDVVVYPVPSWNNNHYCQLLGARGVAAICNRSDDFLPTRQVLEGAVRGARLLVLNSPLNPTGTAFTEDALAGICDLVLEENARRSGDERPLYLMYDQVYWMLTFGSTTHVNPVSLRPEMADYTIFVDGISKSFAATGVRVGWVVGPRDIVERMASIVGHVGAWAPRAEQIATARLLDDDAAIEAYLTDMRQGLLTRLNALFDGMKGLQEAGHPVDVIPPMGAIYLSARFALNGKTTPDGVVLNSNEDIRRYLLDAAGIGIVPFQAFGSTEDTGWFRLSVGAASLTAIQGMLPRLRAALEALT